MIFSKLLLINTLQRLEAQTLGHYCSSIIDLLLQSCDCSSELWPLAPALEPFCDTL